MLFGYGGGFVFTGGIATRRFFKLRIKIGRGAAR